MATVPQLHYTRTSTKMQSHIIINTELNLIISDFSYSPELNLFNESKEIEYDRARIKIDIKAFVISYTLAPTLYGGHSSLVRKNNLVKNFDDIGSHDASLLWRF